MYVRLIIVILLLTACKVHLFGNNHYYGTAEEKEESGNVKNENAASSLKVSKGCCAMMYEGKDFTGENKKVCHDVEELALFEWNGKVSSVKLHQSK